MGRYDAEVIQRLGKEAYDYVLDRVKCGVISAQHMNNISHGLHPYVHGNHQRRIESGKVCDVAEFCRILDDWYKEEMFDLDEKTALGRLVAIVRSASVNLPAEGKRLEQFLEATKAKETSVQRVVLLGESGTGKSSIGNCLLGLNSSEGFRVSRETDSCTKEAKEILGTWVTTGTECAIIDTPGLNDSNNEDTKHIRGIVEFLRHRERVNSFLVFRNGHNPRMNHSFKSMLSTFELTFGENFWRHVIIVVSAHGGYGDDPDQQLSIERWKKRIKEIFPKSANAPLETVVLDAKMKDRDRFQVNAEKLWKLVSAMESFECRDLTAVMTELDEKREMIKDLLEELATLKSLAGTQ